MQKGWTELNRETGRGRGRATGDGVAFAWRTMRPAMIVGRRGTASSNRRRIFPQTKGKILAQLGQKGGSASGVAQGQAFEAPGVGWLWAQPVGARLRESRFGLSPKAPIIDHYQKHDRLARAMFLSLFMQLSK